MELRTLRHLVAVVEHASFTGAARELHITQPALSRSIGRLEAELDTRLLERTSDGVSLTRAGAIVYERAIGMLNDWRTTRSEIEAVRKGSLGEVAIGATPSLRDGVLLDAALALRARHPGLRFRIVSGLTGGGLTDQLRKGELELILGPQQESPQRDGLVHEPLFSDYVCPIASPGASKGGARSSRTTLRDLAAREWVLFGAEILSRRHLAGVFIAAGLKPPEPVVACDAPELALALVLRSGLVGYLPRRYYSALQIRGDIVELDAKGLHWKQAIALSYRADRALSPGARIVVEELRRVVARRRHGDPAIARTGAIMIAGSSSGTRPGKERT